MRTHGRRMETHGGRMEDAWSCKCCVPRPFPAAVRLPFSADPPTPHAHAHARLPCLSIRLLI
eukprot:54298-Chlamydomonas_euryale.AAC.1